MLILAKITRGQAGGYGEYLEGKAQAPALGDYYLKDGERTEAPGRWVQGAAQFGLDVTQPVSADQLHALMDVRRPDTGEELRRAGAGGEAVAAIDATFSAPKSVSAAWALATSETRDAIERAHELAVDRALAYATRHVRMLRRRVDEGTVIHEKAVGMVATSWRHTTARAVESRAPDPQLHSHVLLHVAVRGDGRLVAIDSRSWLVHQRELGAAYRTELARELHRLGFEIRRGTGRGGRYFELDVIPQALLDRWSSRHHQVQAAIRRRLADREPEHASTASEGRSAKADSRRPLNALHEARRLSPAQERAMGTLTRSAKVPVTISDLDAEWRRTARQLGVTRKRIEQVRDQPARCLKPAATVEMLEALTEFDATFAAREARAVALERSAGAPAGAALERLRALRASGDILILADGTGTTRDHRDREQTTVAVADRLARATVSPLASSIVDREIERLDRELAERGGRLAAEQRQSIWLGCGGRQLVVIVGHAGTGKSKTLTGIARAHQAEGWQIVVTSTAAAAAERLASDLTAAGVEASAYSTAAFHAAIASGRIELSTRTTVVHDEAALGSTHEQQQLLTAVERSGARLIEIGDPGQSQPVGAGGLWPHLEHAAEHAGACRELTRNQRALDPHDRRDQARFRSSKHEQAIRGYAARGRLHLTSEQSQAEDLALDAAHADRQAGKHTLVIAQSSNEQLDALNARAQAIRRQHGQLGPDLFPVPGRPYSLSTGDDVQIRHTIRHAEIGAMRNGTSVRVTSVAADGATIRLALADDREVTLDRDQAARADLRLAYIQHPFPAQGITTDTTHVIVAAHATREGTYVALTRAREQTHIYAANQHDPSTDPLTDLTERISHTEPELPSIQTPLERIEPSALNQSRTATQAELDLELVERSRRWPNQPGQQPDPLVAQPDVAHDRSRDGLTMSW